MKETVTLNTQEQKRVMVLNRILEGHLSAAEAALLLNVSKRQVQRILAAYRKEAWPPLSMGTEIASPNILFVTKCGSIGVGAAYTEQEEGLHAQFVCFLLLATQPVNLVAGLIAYCHQPKKPSLGLQPLALPGA